MFPHETSKGYSNPAGQVISEVNGRKIHNLRHLAETLMGINQAEERFVEFSFADKYVETLVFDRQAVMQSIAMILEENGIRQPCSEDFRDVWNVEK